MTAVKNFWRELVRRNVIRVCLAYLLVALNLIIMLNNQFTPVEPGEGFYANFYLFLLSGLVLIGALSWTFEFTPAGFVLAKHVDKSKSFARSTGKKLNKAILGLAGISLLQFLYGLFLQTPSGN